jgi:hypothetical protein
MILTSVVPLVLALEEVYVHTLREVLAAFQPEATVVSITVMNSIKQSLSVILIEVPTPAVAVPHILEKPT